MFEKISPDWPFCVAPDSQAPHYTVQRLTDRRYTPDQRRTSSYLKIAKLVCNALELGATLYSVAPKA